MPELENLDNVSFSELMKKSVSEIPQFCPEWTDFNAHDPGITFLEMLMWLTEMQRYYLSQITENHLKSYLRLIGTTARSSAPAVILARFSSEETVFVKKEDIFYIGDIPYHPTYDTVITPDKSKIFVCENGSVLIRQIPAPFKGGILPLFFSTEDTNLNPMRAGFYPQAEIKAHLITQSSEIECPVADSSYGFYQSGFISIGLPEDFDESASFLRLEHISDNALEPPSADCFNFCVRELIQQDKKGKTLGANGRVKENISFSAYMDGQKITAAVYREISSGRNAETPQDAFKRFRTEQQCLPRAVSKEDYARLAMATPGLRAELVNVFSKEPGKVSVCVKPIGGILYENQVKNLRKVLFEAKPVGTEIEILTPIIFSARLVISAKTDGWAGNRKLSEHIGSIFEPLEKNMGTTVIMTELLKQIGLSPIVSEIKSMRLRLGKGIELTEKDTFKLPDDGLLSLDEIIIQ